MGAHCFATVRENYATFVPPRPLPPRGRRHELPTAPPLPPRPNVAPTPSGTYRVRVKLVVEVPCVDQVEEVLAAPVCVAPYERPELSGVPVDAVCRGDDVVVAAGPGAPVVRSGPGVALALGVLAQPDVRRYARTSLIEKLDSMTMC